MGSIEDNVISLIRSTEYLLDNFRIEANSSTPMWKKIEWAKDFLENDGLQEDATWLSTQLSMIVIELCDWAMVFHAFEGEHQ